MSKIKKLVLGLSVAMVIGMVALFSVIGLNANQPKASNGGNPSQETTKPAVTPKPKKYTYNASDVKIVKGGDVINYNYQPNMLLGDTASVIAYEYCFGSSMDETMAVGINSINASEVDVSFTYSKNTPLNLSGAETLTGYTNFTTQTLENKGDYIYVYIIVSPRNQNVPATFTRNIVWYYGKAGTISIVNTFNNQIITQTIVKGQEIEMPEIDGINYDDIEGWYLDEACTIPATFPLKTEGITLYINSLTPTEGNLPTDWLQLDGDHYVVVQGSSALPAQLVIPSTYRNKPVTEIADGDIDAGLGGDYSSGVFYGQTHITSVSLPETLEYIGFGAFIGCTFTSIDLPDNIHTINVGAFAFCTGLTSIKLPKNLTALMPLTFSDCTNLKYVDASGTNIEAIKTQYGGHNLGSPFYMNTSDTPALSHINLVGCVNLTTIEESAFANCQNLATFTLPASVCEIYPYAFEDCTGLMKFTLEDKKDWFLMQDDTVTTLEIASLLYEVDLSNSMLIPQAILDNPGCHFLKMPKEPNLPSDWLQLVGNHYEVVTGTSELPSILVIPDYYNGKPVTRIADASETIGGNMAFYGQNGIMAVRLPETLEYIGMGAFASCESLLAVTMPEGIRKIGMGAFAQSGLMTINIPKTTQYIGQAAFYQCSNLMTMTLLDKNDWIAWTGGTSMLLSDIAALYEQSGIGDLYSPEILAMLATDEDSLGIAFTKGAPAPNLPEDWLTLSGNRYLVTNGTSTLPDVVSIPNDYNGLPVVEISSGAFADCTNITDIYIPENIGMISADSMIGCTNLTNIYLENKNDWYCVVNEMYVTLESMSLMEGADFTDPSVMAQIAKGNDAGADLVNLPKYISLYLASESNQLFGYLPEDWLTLDGDHYVVTKGTSKIPSTALIIPEYYNGKPVTEIAGGDVEAGLNGDFSSFVFAGTDLNVVILPKTMKHIGDGAFAMCENLMAVTMPEGLETIGMGAFAGSELVSINIPKSATDVGLGAFMECSNLTFVSLLDSEGWVISSEDGEAILLSDYAALAQSQGIDVYNPQVLAELIKEMNASYSKAMPTANLPDDWISLNTELGGYMTIKGTSQLPNILSLPRIYNGDEFVHVSLSVFSNCDNITRIYIPETVNFIDSSAMEGCTSLTHIYLERKDNWFIMANDEFVTLESMSLMYGMDVTDPVVLAQIAKDGFGYAINLSAIAIGVEPNLPEDWLTFNGDHYVVTKGTSSLPRVLIIPAYYNGLPVTTIAGGDVSSALEGDFSSMVFAGEEFDFVILPDTMKHIGDGAFAGCEIRAITMPHGLKTIGMGAFAYSGLTSINIPKTVTEIGMGAFMECPNLMFVSLPDTYGWNLIEPQGNIQLTLEEVISLLGADVINPQELAELLKGELGMLAWFRTGTGEDVEGDGPTRIVTLDGLTLTYNVSTSSYHVSGCDKSLSGDIVIPASYNNIPVTRINNMAFINCDNITSVFIPEGVTTVGEMVFWNMDMLTTIYFPSTLNTIEGTAVPFSGSSALMEIYNLSSLNVNLPVVHTSLSEPSAIQVIDNVKYCIYDGGCILLYMIDKTATSVKIDARTTVVAGNAFGDSLTGVYITNISAWCNIDFYEYDFWATPFGTTPFANNPDAKLYINNNLTTNLVIPEGVTTIGAFAFYYYSGLTSVTIPSSVTKIGECAFGGCSNLTSITFDDTSTWYSKSTGSSSSTQIDVSDPSTNVTHFTSAYEVYKSWYKI